jgi:hypothetical protein
MHDDQTNIHIQPHSQQDRCSHSPMLKTAQYTSYRLIRSAPQPRSTNLTRTTLLPSPSRTFSCSLTRSITAKMDAYKKVGNREDAPPKHEMVHFPGLMSEKRSFGDFRTVLHTGLFSQIVAMEVPVNGEIGDEVRETPNH